MVSNSYGTAKRCAKCNKYITETSLEVDGKSFHPWCFTCKACGKPIQGNFIPHKKNYYHPSCYTENHAPRCAECNRPIDGAYLKHDGKVYHESCYRDNIAKVCIVCNQAIVTGSSLHNEWGEHIHAEHKPWVEHCNSCNRFVFSKHGYKLGDGRFQCPECSKTEIIRERDARRVMKEAYSKLAQYGIRITTPVDAIEHQLVDSKRLNHLHKSSGSGDQYGLTHSSYQSRNGKIVSRDFKIYILSNLPYEVYLSVVAHELFHVWQNEHDCDGGDAAWREGSANVASYLVLKDLNNALAVHHIKQMDETEDINYGEGYRRALKFYQVRGMRPFLAEVERRCFRATP
ncbi:hypothetical protein K8I28_04695 [bacterium]|nr:hypothetical protein [bacterium]